MQKEKRPVSPPSGPQPGRWVLSHGEIRVIVSGLMLAMFLAALNQTIVATALPTIGREFQDFELLPWVVTSYLLTSTAVAPLYGKLSDIYGRRAMMLAGIGIFIAGSRAT
jgi:MFS family permease